MENSTIDKDESEEVKVVRRKPKTPNTTSYSIDENVVKSGNKNRNRSKNRNNTKKAKNKKKSKNRYSNDWIY